MNTPTPAYPKVAACPICGSDVTEETGYADNFGRGEYQYAQCQDCTYQSDWPDHMRLHIFADPEVAYEAWIRTIPGEFDRPHISEAFAAGYAAGQALASASAVGDAPIVPPQMEDEPQGTFACPICGQETPHQHSAAVVAAWHKSPDYRGCGLCGGQNDDCPRCGIHPNGGYK